MGDRAVGSAPDLPRVAATWSDLERAGEIDHRELVSFLQFLFVAGHETTTALLAHGAALLAGDSPLRQRLRDDRSAVPAFVKEVLRTHSPLQRLFRRVAWTTTLACSNWHPLGGSTLTTRPPASPVVRPPSTS